jgi:hypothetical protein
MYGQIKILMFVVLMDLSNLGVKITGTTWTYRFQISGYDTKNISNCVDFSVRTLANRLNNMCDHNASP